MRLEDVSEIEEFLSIFFEEVNFILLAFEDLLLLGELLVSLSDYAHSRSDVILILLDFLIG
jgi:hypothetical protein